MIDDIEFLLHMDDKPRERRCVLMAPPWQPPEEIDGAEPDGHVRRVIGGFATRIHFSTDDAAAINLAAVTAPHPRPPGVSSIASATTAEVDGEACTRCGDGSIRPAQHMRCITGCWVRLRD